MDCLVRGPLGPSWFEIIQLFLVLFRPQIFVLVLVADRLVLGRGFLIEIAVLDRFLSKVSHYVVRIHVCLKFDIRFYGVTSSKLTKTWLGLDPSILKINTTEPSI